MTLAVKERGRAQLEFFTTFAAMSGKVAAIALPSGWGQQDCLEAKNLLAAADREGFEEGSLEEGDEEAREATALAVALPLPLPLERREAGGGHLGVREMGAGQALEAR